jgi:hypothetical protein
MNNLKSEVRFMMVVLLLFMIATVITIDAKDKRIKALEDKLEKIQLK